MRFRFLLAMEPASALQWVDNLRTLPKLGKNAPEETKAFWAYGNAALADDAIPKKYKELMAVAVALTMQ